MHHKWLTLTLTIRWVKKIKLLVIFKWWIGIMTIAKAQKASRATKTPSAILSGRYAPLLAWENSAPFESQTRKEMVSPFSQQVTVVRVIGYYLCVNNSTMIIKLTIINGKNRMAFQKDKGDNGRFHPIMLLMVAWMLKGKRPLWAEFYLWVGDCFTVCLSLDTKFNCG